MKAETKIRQQTAAKESTRTDAQAISKGVITAMTGVSVVVGLWVTASFVGALITAGGPLALLRSWFQAVTGM